MTIPTEVVRAFLMADLCGYTALTEAMGDLEAAKVIGRYEGLAHEAMAQRARLVERVGDELLITSDDVASVVRTAVRLRAVIEAEPLFPAVRVGLHGGRVLEHQRKYLGAVLNLTARVAAHAAPDQILCTEPIAAVVNGLDDVTCRAAGIVRFKNLVEPVPIFEVLGPIHGGVKAFLDPVCRMHVALATAPARLPFEGTTYYFCSFGCAKAFAHRPEAYGAKWP
jgi:class 3 adenylate cyclase